MRHPWAFRIATCFGIGLIRPILLRGMAGTYGSMFSLPFCYAALEISKYVADPLACYATILLFVLQIGTWSIPYAEDELGPQTDWRGKTKDHDQNQIVIDEMMGMLITCIPLLWLCVDSTALSLAAAFAAFRLFDITKPLPIAYFDRMKNAAGVMLDDVMAGIYGACALIVLHLLVGI